MKVLIKIGDLSFRFVGRLWFAPSSGGSMQRVTKCAISSISRLTITKCFRFENSVEWKSTTFGFGFKFKHSGWGSYNYVLT